MNIEIANRLVELRRTAGLSQEDLAARLGVSRQAVSKWERAESSPDTDNLIGLARLYGVSLDTLLLEDGAAAQAQAAPEPEYAPRGDTAMRERIYLTRSFNGRRKSASAGKSGICIFPTRCLWSSSISSRVLCSNGGIPPGSCSLPFRFTTGRSTHSCNIASSWGAF